LVETLGGVLSLREEEVLFESSDWLRVGSGSRELEGGIFGRIRWIGWMGFRRTDEEGECGIASFS
jgi:hypothetical protein